jgi:hypothetical protein
MARSRKLLCMKGLLNHPTHLQIAAACQHLNLLASTQSDILAFAVPCVLAQKYWS